MRIFQLDCFLAVANHLNFARAAEDMMISQPAITNQIHALEDELNVKLFKRTTRSVELTSEGTIFLDDARMIVSTAKRAIKRFEKSDQKEIIDLSVGATCQAELQYIPDVLQELVAQYPNIHPRLTLLRGSQLMGQIAERKLDFAIGFQVPEKKKNALCYQELKKSHFVCLSKEPLPVQANDTVSLSEIAQHNMILFTSDSALPDVISLQLRLSHTKLPSELYFCESSETAKLLVQSGLGILIAPETSFYLQNDIYQYQLPDIKPLSFGIYYPANQRKPYLKDFIRLLKQRMQDL